jgi:ribulose-5-phosphate 4-epimerase/fuculose-1-phosphate aldolase
VLASLDDSSMPPIEQNTATFYNRYVIDENFGGLAFEEEGERCAGMLNDPSKKVMIMGNHGVLVTGADVADAFNRFYYFERAAETYIKSLWTQKPLRILSDKIAEKTASELENYPDQSMIFFDDLKALLNEEEPSYRN